MALAVAATSAADVDNVQLHGTGTALGDPIEVGALQSALATVGSRSSSEDPRPLTLEAAKTVAGHCEAASGIIKPAN
eukprot:8355016-Pyramimonas_sp.AAC.1